MDNFKNLEIILVNTQIPENLGFVARAMLNCGLKKLRLVSPEFDIKHCRVLRTNTGKRRRVDEDLREAIVRQGNRSTDFRPQDLVRITECGTVSRVSDWQKSWKCGSKNARHNRTRPVSNV